LLVRACNQLGQFLSHRETNLRYLALESMCLLATSEFSHDAVKKHQETVINALKTERDVSVRQRAVDLLYAMCDRLVLLIQVIIFAVGSEQNYLPIFEKKLLGDSKKDDIVYIKTCVNFLKLHKILGGTTKRKLDFRYARTFPRLQSLLLCTPRILLFLVYSIGAIPRTSSWKC
jgi:hypothetical protein